MRNVYTVKQVNAYIKNMFTQDFMLNRIYIKGEVSNCKYHSSGHIYFSLKDATGMLACVMFASQRKGLSFPMKDGQQVVVFGGISTYERDGKYQLYANEIILDGIGLLYQKYETLKNELEEMGMFSKEYKQPIPFCAKKIGIVTAPTGAAIRDIIQVATRRNPYIQLILYPALVQGEEAKDSIIEGIHALEKKRVDVIIVGRGGGSIEDLWAFNEEEVARAIFECSIPIISAVGHETDTTIADYVSDLRAPTPSAAAELAVCEYAGIVQMMWNYRQSMRQLIIHNIRGKRQNLEQYKLNMKLSHPSNHLREKKLILAEMEDKLKIRMNQKIMLSRHQFEVYKEMLKGQSPIDKLNQGYAYVQSMDGLGVKTIDAVSKGDLISVYVTDGIIQTEVINCKKESHYAPKKR